MKKPEEKQKKFTVQRKKTLLIGYILFNVGWYLYFGINYILGTFWIWIVSATSFLILIVLLYKFVHVEMKEEK